MENFIISAVILIIGILAVLFAYEAIWNAKEMPDDFDE